MALGALSFAAAPAPAAERTKAPGLSWLRAVADAGPGVAAALVGLVCYVRTLHPGLDYHDFGEMQFTARALGVAHGSGYPLYIWLGHLFDYLPIRTAAYRLNLFSAVCGAVAVFQVYAIAVRLVGRGWGARIGAAAAALAFALSYSLWSIAVFAQMYTLQVALTLQVVWFAVRNAETDDLRYLGAMAFTFGAMFGNHLCTLSLGPGVGLYTLLAAPRGLRSLRKLGVSAGSLLAGILLGNVALFWLLWHRHLPYDQFHVTVLANPDLFPQFAGGDTSFWRCWWFQASTQQFRWAFSPSSDWLPSQLHALPHRFIAEFFPLGVLAGLWGMYALTRRHFSVSLLLFAICLTQTALNLHYENWKVPYYFIPPYACFAVWIGVGLGQLGAAFEAVSRFWPFPWSQGRRTVALASFFVFLLGVAAAADLWSKEPYLRWLQHHEPKSAEIVRESLGPRPDKSWDHRAEGYAHQFLSAIPDGSLVLADWNILYALVYAAHVENEKPNVDFQESYPSPAGYPMSAAKQQRLLAESKRRPVYIIGDANGAKGPYKLTPVGQSVWKIE